MKIGIVQLTDLHIKENSVFFEECFNSMISKTIDKFSGVEIEKIFLILSGDIAFSGKKKEYDIASKYIDLFIDKVKQDLNKDIELIMVPGNHDCNLNYSNQVRTNLLKNIDYKTLGEDESVIDECVRVQKDFWEFYRRYNEEPKNELYFSIKEKDIIFRCYNTAWMSQKNEQPGSLFFPIKLIENREVFQNNSSLGISVYHHPINWFNPNTEENNKEEFRLHLEKYSSIQLVGHEHEYRYREEINHNINVSSNIFYGQAFLNLNDNSSGFHLIYIDVTNKKGNIYEYMLDGKEYKRKFSKEIYINNRDIYKLSIKNEFIEKNEDIKIPFLVNNYQPKLTQIFVYPDIKPILSEDNDILPYVDAGEIIESEGNIIIEGDTQSGKSSLIFKYFLDFYNKGYFPLLIDAKNIKSTKIDNFLKKIFLEIYEGDYQCYEELSKDKKVLLIDDFNDIYIKRKDEIEKFLSRLNKIFSRIIITINTENQILPYFYEVLKDYERYEIIPFGYEKRDKLIEKYLMLKNDLSIDEQQFYDEIKDIFDKMQQIIGDKLIPAYPIYLISILKVLVDTGDTNLHLTSYGYCYQSLITLALSKEVKPEDIDSFINFLKELSFFMYERNIKYITYLDLEKFINNYKKEYIIKSKYNLIDILIKSYILKKDDDYIKFRYKYIFYFFVAQYISENKENEKIKKLIYNLITDIHVPENANILVFIAHHIRDISFIDDINIASMCILENKEPITLEKYDTFYHLIESIIKEVSRKIIEEKDPKEERKRKLKAQDQYFNGSLENIENEKEQTINDFSEDLVNILKSMRAIEVLGQIIKNRYGSLKKEYQKEIIEILYDNAFKLIRAITELLEKNKQSFEKDIEEKIKNVEEKIKIEKSIDRFVQFIELSICLGIFSKLVYSVGIKDLKEVFNEVAQKMNTPAAKLVSFSINSYYNKISIQELKHLAREFKDNPIAFQILRTRVISYMYENYIEFSKKQQIADIMGLDIRKISVLGKGEDYD